MSKRAATTTPANPEILRGRVTALSYGPHAIIRHQGKVHFVRNAAPGDEIDFRPREERGNHCFSDIVALVEAGPARHEAPCRWLPDCGGCPWQHVTPQAQAQAKQNNLRETLVRVGGFIEPPVEALLQPSSGFGYRRRLSLRVHDRQVGFHAAGSHRLVAVDECLIAAPALQGGIALAGGWVAGLRTRLSRIEVASVGDGDRIALVGQCDGALVEQDLAASDAFLRANPRLSALVLHGRGFRHVLGDDRIQVPLERDLGIEVRAGDFTQVNDAGNRVLIETVLQLGAPSRSDVVADLYGGAGNFALPIARRAGSVHVVEHSQSAVQSGQNSARHLGFTNAEFEQGDVGRVLRAWADAAPPSGKHFDLVVLDPPRSGAAEAVEPLLRLAPSRLVYVSCNPATLARDLRALSVGYTIRQVVPIDLFPQTHHLESVTLLTRTGIAPPPAAARL